MDGIRSKRDADWAVAERIAEQCGATPEEAYEAIRLVTLHDVERLTYGGIESQ